MKNTIIVALTSVLLTFAANLCTAADTATDSQPVQLTEKYTNAEKGYSISYPESWKKTDVPRLDLVLFAQPKDDDTAAHASMNIVSEKVGPGITLEQFYTESATNLTTALKNVKVEKKGTSDLNGVEARWILYTHEMQSVKFRVLQFFIVANQTVYLLTFSTVADSFDDYQSEFDAVSKSFRLEKAPSK